MTSLSIPKYVYFLAVLLLAAPVAHGRSAARYEAVFSDGTRLEGDKVSGWGAHLGSPRLNNIALFDAKRPLRWLHDRGGKAWRPSEHCAYIEFVGGDRLVGRIEGVGAGGGLSAAAHLLVRPAVSLCDPAWRSLALVRILPGRIERVVFGHVSRRRLQPGALYYLDGRRLGFVRLRWRAESVVLLLKDGAREVKMSEIEEVHLPQIDPWRAYYQELAILSPSCRSRLLRIETTGGLIATASSLRFGASPYATDAHQQAAVAHLQQMDQQTASIAGKRKANQLRFDEARAKYNEQSIESEKQKKAARQAYQKAVGEIRQRIEEQRKADLAELTRQREELVRELRAVEQAVREQLGDVSGTKRDKKLRTLRAKQAQLRKRLEKPLEVERLKRGGKKQKAPDRLIGAQEQKFERLVRELDNKVSESKRRFEDEARRWKEYLRSLESLEARRTLTGGGAEGNANTWHHILQPVWSLDPLWIPFRGIHTRWSFAPEQVPLCRVPPDSTVSPPFLPRCINRNSAGRPLRSGGDEYAWGFAVHAYSELRFPLPKCAKAFRSRIGLDGIVESGGCARARVYVGSTGGKSVYESPLLVGSKKTVDTGRVPLNLPPTGPRLLVLQADPVNRGSPPGADPLNIRDKLDWLDPRIELDKTALQEQVRLHVGPLIAASPGWALRLDRRGVYTWTSRLDTTEQPGVRRFRTMLQARGQPLTVWREMKIGPADKWLAVYLGVPAGENPRPDAVALRVGERQVQARTVPVRQLWQGRPAPLLFPLDEYQGKKLTLELNQPAGGKPLHWQAVSTAADLPPAYRLAEIMEFVGKSDMRVPYELGQALQSNRIAKQEKLVALEINQLGGRVNFRPYPATRGPLDKLSNVLLGSDWTGGDKTFIEAFTTFRKLPGLEMLVVTKASGVSDGAMAKLQAEMPKLSVTRIIPRTPSYRGGKQFGVTRRNLTGRYVIVLYVDPEGKLRTSGYLKPWQVKLVRSSSGSRLEAHYLRKDYTSAEQYTFSLPLTTCHSTPGVVWDIRPVGK